MKWVYNPYRKSFLPDQLGRISKKEFQQQVLSFHQKLPDYSPTPLIELPNLAKWLEIDTLFIKDESTRFGLNAFKSLGASYTMAQWLAEKFGKPLPNIEIQALKRSSTRNELGNITFSAATDGNHGRGVAWFASCLGYPSIVYMPQGSSKARIESIRQSGAEVVVTDLSYDQTVNLAAQKSKENSWTLIQDTAWEGYKKIPSWVMEGYTTVAQEILFQRPELNLSHIFLQGGVGSFAAAITAVFSSALTLSPPIIIIAEPERADCLFQSAKQGRLTSSSKDLHTLMVGLACGNPNPLAWEILKECGDYFLTLPDPVAATGMRMLGHPLGNDPPITSGESGAVTAGLLAYLSRHPDYQKLRDRLHLGKNSKILLISTEGNTDPGMYRKIVWGGMVPSDLFY